ncbi:hypothetical protein CsSME_00042403 [Camellia sinensis var. sinensis]
MAGGFLAQFSRRRNPEKMTATQKAANVKEVIEVPPVTEVVDAESAEESVRDDFEPTLKPTLEESVTEQRGKKRAAESVETSEQSLMEKRPRNSPSMTLRPCL